MIKTVLLLTSSRHGLGAADGVLLGAMHAGLLTKGDVRRARLPRVGLIMESDLQYSNIYGDNNTRSLEKVSKHHIQMSPSATIQTITLNSKHQLFAA